MSDTSMAPSESKDEQADTFHDQDAMMRVALTAGRMSSLFLVVFGLVGVLILVLLYWYFTGKMVLLQLISYLIFALVPFLLGGFFWVASRLFSEWVYIFMDIEENTRHKKTSSVE